MHCRLGLLAAVLVASVMSCFADRLQLMLATPTLLQERLRAGQVRGRERQNLAEHLFSQVGCQV